MIKQEAYQLLELQPSATEEEIKKSFRKLAAKYHPDRNKDVGAEDKFKQINQAYQTLTNPEPEQPMFQAQPGHNPFGDIFSHFGSFQHQRQRDAEPIHLSTNLTFAESILGVKKRELKFSREVKCQSCNGEGRKKINNGCQKCGGSGQFVRQQGNTVMMQQCPACRGKSKTEDCSACDNEGVITKETSVAVDLPGGVSNGITMCLNNMGNFIGTFGPMDQYTDTLVALNIEEDPELKLEGKTVVSHLSISLLEALQGCKKTIKTVLGEKEITIPIKTKNMEEVILRNVGINGTGNQNVILEVQYPDNIENLIKALNV